MKRWLVLFSLLLSLLGTPFVSSIESAQAQGCQGLGHFVRGEAATFHPLGQTIQELGFPPLNDEVAQFQAIFCE